MTLTSHSSLKRTSWFMFLSLALAACGTDPTPHAAPEPAQHDLPTVTVAVELLPVHYETVGSVVSDQRIEISSRITAYLRRLDVREGDAVQRGQALATLDSEDLESAIQQASAQHQRAQAVLADAERTLADTGTLYARKLVAESALRRAQVDRDIAARELEAAKAMRAAARSQMDYAQIVSPVDGVVVERAARSGDLVTPGAPIVVVESDTALLFETHVAESQLAKLRVGDAVRVDIEASGHSLGGRIARLVPSGDPVTRRYLAKIQLDQADGLAPGMFGRCTFMLAPQPGIAIPTTALAERGSLTGAFVVDDAQRLRFRWLRTGRVLGDRTEITSGLTPGETLLQRVDDRVRDGDLLMTPGAP